MNINKITIRNMIASDIDFVTHANKEVHEASNQTSEIQGFKERIRKDVLSDSPKAFVIVAENEGKTLGMALYSTIYFADEGQIMWLSNIFVEKEYRNQDIAKQMMNHLKKICTEKGYYAICGAVDEDNKISKEFFNGINGKWLESFKMFVVK